MADTSNIATGVSTVQISHIYVRNFKNSEENFLKAIDAKLHNEVVDIVNYMWKQLLSSEAGHPKTNNMRQLNVQAWKPSVS